MSSQAGGVMLDKGAMVRWLEIRLGELRAMMKPGESLRIDLPAVKRHQRLVAVIHVDRDDVDGLDEVKGGRS